MNDYHVSQGPVRTLPGSLHPFPEGTVCDVHQDCLAYVRIQGYTDSFGCEYHCLCSDCFSQLLDEVQQNADSCDSCGKVMPLYPERNPDESGAGRRVYWHCSNCR